MSTQSPKASEHPRDPNPNSSKWTRNEHGTYEDKYDGEKMVPIKIANYGIRIQTIFIVLGEREYRVKYRLEIDTPDGTKSCKIRHEDLADEQSLYRAMPAGFSLTAIHKSFARLRECLMEDLKSAERAAVVTCLGWYIWQGCSTFAHGGGIIRSEDFCLKCDQDGPNGTSQLLDLTDIDKACSDVPILAGADKPIEAVHVEVSEQLSRYTLSTPKTRDVLHGAINAVLQLLELGDPDVTYIVIPSLFGAAICDPRFAIFLQGETGTMKTSFALLMLSFFVPGSKESDCASFKSTENALRARFEATGNVVAIVDDYVESPGSRNGGKESEKADDFIRSVVNRTGKDRCNGDGSLRPRYTPRGLPLVTGEVLPDGLESLRRRMVNLRIDKTTFEKAVSGKRPNRFDWFQSFADDGVFATAMGAYISWAAGRLEMVRDLMDYTFSLKASSVHFRLKDAADFVLSAMGCFLAFAKDVGVVSESDCEAHLDLAWDAVQHMLDRVYLESLEDCPTEAFAQLLHAALSSGRCHIEIENFEVFNDLGYNIPLDLLGYSEQEVPINRQSSESSDLEEDDEDDFEYRVVRKPHGPRIGWMRGDTIDLIPEAALAEANKMASQIGLRMLPEKKVFGKMLVAKEWIAKRTSDRNTYKIKHGDVTRDVWRIHALRLFEPALSWSDFDIASYRQMTEVERQKLSESRRQEELSKLRRKLADFQAAGLLNAELMESDKKNLLIPDPPELNNIEALDNDNPRRFIPPPPQVFPLPGYDEPETDEDGLYY